MFGVVASSGGGAWTPASLSNWAAGGDWFNKNANVFKNGSYDAAVPGDPTAVWRGNVNAVEIAQGTAGNMPSLTADGVRFFADGASRWLATSTAIDPDKPTCVWAKVNSANVGNATLFMGLISAAAPDVMNGFAHAGASYVYQRGNGIFGAGTIAGLQTLIMDAPTGDASAPFSFYLDNDPAQTGYSGSGTAGRTIGISSGTYASADFTVIDFGVYFGGITAGELDNLKTYLAGL